MLEDDALEPGREGVVKTERRRAEHPENLAGVEHQPLADTLTMVLVRVTEKRGVALSRGGESKRVFLVVREADPMPIDHDKTELAVVRDARRGIQLHLEREESIGVVVTENGVNLSGELSQLARDEGGDQIAAMKNDGHAALLQLRKGVSQIREMVVAVTEHSEDHDLF